MIRLNELYEYGTSRERFPNSIGGFHSDIVPFSHVAGMKNIALAWSGGKDSALALQALSARPDVRVSTLLTTVSRENGRVPMHEVPGALIRAQAREAGLPLLAIELPPHASNGAYEQAMHDGMAVLKERGIAAVAFGDLFLEDIRAYRERNLAAAGMEGIYPLWGEDTGELIRRFVAGGFASVVTCVDTARLAPAFSGRLIDAAFVTDLPAGVDPCGENGEYHSFCFRGPIFKNEIQFERGARNTRDGFCFTELRPVAAPRPSFTSNIFKEPIP